jgi:predicted oxidoreductase (fatty acid repression mutant protein)
MSKDIYRFVKERRSIYGISSGSPVSDERIKEIIEHAVKHAPSAFNSQSSRIVVLLGEQHNKLWDIAKETLRKIVPAEQFAATEAKINSFKIGYGTILCFEDKAVIEGLQKNFELYKDNFPVWAQQSNGMLQYIIWTSLHAEGFGVTLQHYSNLIEAEVKKQWNLPDSWELIAQMPFGKPTAEPKEKEFLPVEDRVIVLK